LLVYLNRFQYKYLILGFVAAALAVYSNFTWLNFFIATWGVFNLIVYFFTSKEKKKVLHFAPEQAFYKLFRNQKNLDYTTTDLFSPLADVKADICNLPFEDNQYDVILCNHVLEHIPDDTKAMQELYRVLKPGGMAILQIPQDLKREVTFADDSITDQKERAKIFGQYDHVRIYGRDYFDKLRSIGFEVNEVDYTKTLAPELVDKYCLAQGEIIPVCTKK